MATKFEKLAQFVPQEVCLSCDGCCRFKDEKSSWRPKVTQEEIDILQLEETQVFSLSTVDLDHHLKTSLENHVCKCTFFDLKTNKCKIYSHRPFECELYPFLLVNDNGRKYLGVHLACPHVQNTHHDVVFEQYVETLKKYFAQSQVRDFLSKNLFLFGDYPQYRDEIECIVEVNV